MQNEKRKALLEHETQKLRECDDSLQREIREWKAQLLPRKQVNKKELMGVRNCNCHQILFVGLILWSGFITLEIDFFLIIS